ncbi:BMA_0021/BMA_0022 family TOMM bacteriocin, partial [Burkholderia pseudomallei]
MAENNAVTTHQSLLDFPEVYLRSIALSWENDKFKRDLLADRLDAHERYFDYSCP